MSSSHLNAAETADYSDYSRSSKKKPPTAALQRSRVQPQPQKSSRQKTTDTLESYQNDPDLKEIEVPDDENSSTATALKYSQTHIFIGPAILRGAWSAEPSNTTMGTLGLGQFIYKNPFYLNLNATALLSPSTPRNFMLSGNMGCGLILGSQHVLPFLGFEAGAARMVVSGKGNGFGFKLSPEIGFFPLSIKEHAVYMKLQYNWMTLRIADRVPSWYALMIGVTL